MSQEEIITTVEELQELRRMQEELEAEIKAAQERIKTHMLVNGAETLTAGTWKVSYKAVTSSRFDSTAFRKAMPDLAARFTQSTTTRRFTVQ